MCLFKISSIIVICNLIFLHRNNPVAIPHLQNQECYLVVSKEKMRVTLFDSHGEIIHDCPMSCGQNFGQKNALGDKKTPEGIFYVNEIQESSSWTHDFGDGKGNVKGAYGPYFFRLKTPRFKSIGIHGTHDSTTIGYRNTKGCIRLNNRDLEKLKKYVYIGMKVKIIPSCQDQQVNDEQFFLNKITYKILEL